MPANNIVFDYGNRITIDSSDLTKFNFIVVFLTRSRQFQFVEHRKEEEKNQRSRRKSSKFELCA